MNVVIFCHSLMSDWNHGNAHFLRGVVRDLQERGNRVTVFEPENSWSFQNLVAEHGLGPVREFSEAYPGLRSITYQKERFDLDRELRHADLVLVHEWNDHDLVGLIGQHHRQHRNYVLLFHDTHHRSATEKASMEEYDLRYYDGVLAFGKVIRDTYLKNGWAKQAWTWHEAADEATFKPVPNLNKEGDLVWIGNWGDEERTAELHEFLLEPVKRLGLTAKVYGVRYPTHALKALADAGIEYGGWLPNYKAPQVFARYRMTVHVPRRPYVEALPGIPTIRVFEALACGIPLICSPWNDSESLFEAGRDYLVARDGSEMEKQMSRILNDADFAADLADRGRATILSKHTCHHRVNELLEIARGIKNPVAEMQEVAS